MLGGVSGRRWVLCPATSDILRLNVCTLFKLQNVTCEIDPTDYNGKAHSVNSTCRYKGAEWTSLRTDDSYQTGIHVAMAWREKVRQETAIEHCKYFESGATPVVTVLCCLAMQL